MGIFGRPNPKMSMRVDLFAKCFRSTFAQFGSESPRVSGLNQDAEERFDESVLFDDNGKFLHDAPTKELRARAAH